MAGINKTSNFPKITGKHNNCSINCALPAIFSDISLYSKLEKENSLPTDKIFLNYSKLKLLFAQEYKLDNGKLSWHDFNQLINVFDNNFIQQIIFSPVTRKYIDEKGTIEPSRNAIDNSGRYDSLYSDEVYENFYKDFNLNLHISQEVNGSIELCSKIGTFAKERTVMMYYDSGHFELAPKSLIQSSDIDVLNPPEKFKSISNALLDGGNKEEVLKSFGELTKTIHEAHKNIKSEPIEDTSEKFKDFKEKFSEAKQQSYIAQTCEYLVSFVK